MNNHIQQGAAFSAQTKLVLTLGFILTALVLIFFLPTAKRSAIYNYEVNRPWHYDQLIAPFDFPILLSEEQMKEKRDSAMMAFMPYFTSIDSIKGEYIGRFVQDFNHGKFTGVPANYRTHITTMLEKVYDAGVTKNADYQFLVDHKTKSFRFVRGNVAISRATTSIYTTHSAYDFIMGTDNEHFSRETLQKIDLTHYLSANLQLDTLKTNEALNEINDGLARSVGMVQVGERIIERGEIITPKHYSIISSYLKELDRHSNEKGMEWGPYLGKALLILLFLGGCVAYLHNYRPEYFCNLNKTLLYLCLISIFPLLTYIMIEHRWLNIYMLPYTMVVIFARIFYDSRTALQVGLISVFLSSIVVSEPYTFVLLQLSMVITAIYAVKDLTERAQLFKAAMKVLFMGLTISVVYEIYEGADILNFFNVIDRSYYFSLIISGMLLLLSYPLFYVVERVFGLTSSVTLIELSNINNSILRRMTKVAQGTFNHSVQVGNLASEVADAIGADAQLVRTAAFYHDIGKMLNPSFFTENQQGTNPHDNLDEEESARIIINHVTEGLALATKYHLPQVIIDFISTHHGRSRTGYFYVQWKNKHEGKEPPAEMFTYPGPNPWTKEQAILMMCDAVEASSRSLTEYSQENITSLVNKIIDNQQKEGLFNDSPITFQDITVAKKVLIDSLKVIYHARVAYPEEKKPTRRWFTQRRHR